MIKEINKNNCATEHKIANNQIDKSHWKKGNGLEKGMGREGQTLQWND